MRTDSLPDAPDFCPWCNSTVGHPVNGDETLAICLRCGAKAQCDNEGSWNWKGTLETYRVLASILEKLWEHHTAQEELLDSLTSDIEEAQREKAKS